MEPRLDGLMGVSFYPFCSLGVSVGLFLSFRRCAQHPAPPAPSSLSPSVVSLLSLSEGFLSTISAIFSLVSTSPRFLRRRRRLSSGVAAVLPLTALYLSSTTSYTLLHRIQYR